MEESIGQIKKPRSIGALLALTKYRHTSYHTCFVIRERGITLSLVKFDREMCPEFTYQFSSMRLSHEDDLYLSLPN